MVDWANVYERLRARIEAFGVCVLARRLGLETTGVFDGLSITTNTAYDLETRCHNIAHALGHVAQWSLDYSRQQRLYDDLHAAKANKAADPAALEGALQRFRSYEEEASQYAAWLLAACGPAGALPAFTNFARADIEAIVAFHRDGSAPVWHEFFARWNREVRAGERALVPFAPKPIPPFTPRPIEPQEVIQSVEENS
ncbi:MAG TPA: hypothetical protein VKA46_41220 [Gemmataceae bacterium]|nr:hypothetical protein [Gemmataceae bacterium]